MGFNSAHLSVSTVKSFVDRLLKQQSKRNNASYPLKRNQIQEDVSIMLGYPNWHALTKAVSGDINFEKEEPVCLNNNKITSHMLVTGGETNRHSFFNSLLTSQQPVFYIQGSISIPIQSKFQHIDARGLRSFISLHIQCIDDVLNLWEKSSKQVEHDMWHNRATVLLKTATTVAFYLNANATLEDVRKQTLIDTLVDHLSNEGLPRFVRVLLEEYLYSLPGFNKDLYLNNKKQSETVMEQHGFLQMQLTRMFNDYKDKEMLVLSDRISVKTSDFNEMYIERLFDLIDAWGTKNPGGLLILDGCFDKSWNYEILKRIGKYQNKTHIVMGYYADIDFEDQTLWEKIQLRIKNINDLQ